MNTEISLYEHAVRRIRRMRVSGEPASSIQATLDNLERNLALDPKKLLIEAAKPGPIDGRPFMAAARLTSAQLEKEATP